MTITPGQRFGRLEVLRPDGKNPGGDAMYLCRCHRCGAEKRIRGTYLTGPRQYRDCGCAWNERKKDLTGRTMGALEVLELLPQRKHEQKVYRCRCLVCGQECEAKQHRLLTMPESCGCKRHAFFATEAGREIGRAGSRATLCNGSCVHVANGTEPMPGNTTGFRWVRWYARNKCFAYVFTVAKQRYFRMGFETPEEAHEAAAEAHAAAMKEHGIPTVAGFRTMKKEAGKNAEV